MTAFSAESLEFSVISSLLEVLVCNFLWIACMAEPVQVDLFVLQPVVSLDAEFMCWHTLYTSDTSRFLKLQISQ